MVWKNKKDGQTSKRLRTNARSVPEASCALCRCLDKAATRRGAKQPGQGEKWLYTVTQVEEVKRMLGFLPIMVATIIFNTGEPPPTVQLSLTATYAHRVPSQIVFIPNVGYAISLSGTGCLHKATSAWCALECC